MTVTDSFWTAGIMCVRRKNISAGGSDMIKKVKEGYKALSSKGKNLGGPYETLDEAKKRLRQVEFLKHRKA
jgi:hypothetical protein